MNSVSPALQRVLDRVAQGDDVLVASAAENLVVQQNVVVDAHYHGKPVCTVTLPWVVDGHALLMADTSIDSLMAESRLESLANALAMPLCVIRPEPSPLS